MNSNSWFAVRVKPRSESRASRELLLRGFDTFLPAQPVKRRWSDRVKLMQEALFPGYFFCRFDPLDRVRVLESPGVIQIVGNGNTPVPVDNSEIHAIQTMVASGLPLLHWPYLKAGQRVRIGAGPLAGVEGVIIKAGEGAARVIVSVTLLQRAVSAEIDREWIAAANWPSSQSCFESISTSTFG